MIENSTVIFENKSDIFKMDMSERLLPWFQIAPPPHASTCENCTDDAGENCAVPESTPPGSDHPSCSGLFPCGLLGSVVGGGVQGGPPPMP